MFINSVSYKIVYFKTSQIFNLCYWDNCTLEQSVQFPDNITQLFNDLGFYNKDNQAMKSLKIIITN